MKWWMIDGEMKVPHDDFLSHILNIDVETRWEE